MQISATPTKAECVERFGDVLAVRRAVNYAFDTFGLPCAVVDYDGEVVELIPLGETVLPPHARLFYVPEGLYLVFDGVPAWVRLKETKQIDVLVELNPDQTAACALAA